MKALVLGLSSLLLQGCRTELRLQVNHDPNFFVVARHERHRSAITETAREVLGWEVATTGPDGTFTLSQPRGGFAAYAVTFLLVSKPGFPLYSGQAAQRAALILAPNKSWREEAMATLRFEKETSKLQHLEGVSAHLAARRACLRATWPKEVADDEAAAARHPFVLLPGLSGAVMAAAVLPGAGLARRMSAKLSVTDAAGRVLAETPLGLGPSTSLCRTADRLALLESGSVRWFDLTGHPTGGLALVPPAEDWATSLAVGSDGRIWVGVDRHGDPAFVRVYGPDGHALHTLPAPVLKSLKRVFVAPDGATLAYGELQEDYNYQLRVAGLAKSDGQPRGLVRLVESAAPRVLVRGLDSVAADEDGLVGWAHDVLAPEFEPYQNLPGTERQIVLRLDWSGRTLNHRDVSDRALEGDEALAQPLAGRLVFFHPHDERVLLLAP